MRSSIAPYLVAVALASVAEASMAQGVTYQDIGTANGFRLTIAHGPATARVGNAALVRLIAISKENGWATSPVFLIECNGKWISGIIQSSFQIGESLALPDVYRAARSEEEVTPLDAVEFVPMEEAQLFFAEAVKRKAPSICKAASREPKNVNVPIAETKTEGDIGKSIAIVLGTAGKIGSTIDVWFRTTYYRLTPILKKDGTPLELEGKAQKKKEATGKYSMNRRAIDCTAKAMATYESAEYEPDKSEPISQSVARDKLTLSSVVPGSVGEAQLDAVCALYGLQPPGQ